MSQIVIVDFVSLTVLVYSKTDRCSKILEYIHLYV